MRSLLDWSPGVWLVVDALAVYRLTRLITRDDISTPMRKAITKRWEGPLVTLVGCPWCISIWLGAGTVLATYFAPYWWSFVAMLLALSAVAGYLSGRE